MRSSFPFEIIRENDSFIETVSVDWKGVHYSYQSKAQPLEWNVVEVCGLNEEYPINKALNKLLEAEYVQPSAASIIQEFMNAYPHSPDNESDIGSPNERAIMLNSKDLPEWLSERLLNDSNVVVRAKAMGHCIRDF